MKTDHLTIGVEMIIRFAAVRRWHIVQTDRMQTLAEHACNVAMLAALIAERCGWPPSDRASSE